MMSRFKKSGAGFSLIELLVVISIMAAIMALVGPLTVRSVESAQAQTELVSIERWINGWGRKAFLTGSVISVEARGGQLIAESDGQSIDARALELWQPAESLQIEFSSAGLPSVTRIELVSGNLSRTVSIRGDLPRSGGR
jgi:prepilin-type N-terminal cleavage/methylation domain-containing protein